jgi:hemerythrin-like domain-containing protein
MDAIRMLRDDHRTIERLFKKFEKSESVDRELLEEIRRLLQQHTAIENEVFYPTVLERTEGERAAVLESFEEHHVADALLAELADTSVSDEQVRAKTTVLIELVRHHVEEEEQEMFPDVRNQLGRKALQEVGQRMQELKDRGVSRSDALEAEQRAVVGAKRRHEA